MGFSIPMYVKRLEVQGFKTFAKKTSLSFLAPKDGRNPVTTIVGPNGSGKSNMADAIRWVLGEQSLKTLRGKKSEDVIFSGTKKKGRSGMAEVSITFCNEDASMPLEVSEVTITRRLYRDGDGEYLVNNRKARLADIHLLLAQANVGQRSYSVIGQGMVDHILVSTPEERKAFFDDATGVRPLQLKRHSSMLKLKRTYENMAEVEMLLTEIEPRLRSLKRQANRLERRGQVQEELYKKEAAYYGAKWWGLVEEIERTRKEFEKIDAKVIAEKEKMATREEELAKMEREEKSKSVTDSGLVAMQGQYREKQKEKYKTREQQYEIRKKIELEKVKAQSSWTPLPLKDIIIELEEMVKAHQGLLTKVKGTKNLEEMGGLEALVDGVLKRSTKLVGRLQKPAPEDVKIDPVLQKELVELEKQEKATIAELKQLEQDMEARAKKQKTDRSHLFDLQRELRKFQHELYQLESKRNSMQIESARLEERQNALKREMDEHMKDRGAQVRVERTQLKINEAELYSEIQRLRYKLELIGGIDPEIIQEYEETKTRFEFLSEQVGDLKQAIEATEKVIDQLDKEIKDRGETVFKEINKEFQRFFKVLFGGGTCGLIKLTRDEVKEEVEVTP